MTVPNVVKPKMHRNIPNVIDDGQSNFEQSIDYKRDNNFFSIAIAHIFPFFLSGAVFAHATTFPCQSNRRLNSENFLFSCTSLEMREAKKTFTW